MPTFGYFLSCEEFGPTELVRQAKLAEQAGFRKLWIADHFHPWNDQQGQKPVRVVGDRRAVAGDPPADHDGRDLPDRAVHPA